VGAGYSPLIDAVHRNDFNWLAEKFRECPHRFFKQDLNGNCQVVDFNDEPHFVVFFNVNEDISSRDWEILEAYVFGIVEKQDYGVGMMTRRQAQLLKAPTFIAELELDKEIEEELPIEYGFRSHILIENDVGFFEIVKPYTDRPYVVVIEKYSERGIHPVFTSLFICNSWGICNEDIQFLHQLWNYMGYPNSSFDLDEMLKQATEDCYPREGWVPNCEPVVYRRALEEVVQTWKNKNGVQ
jgi:hypothetical protein